MTVEQMLDEVQRMMLKIHGGGVGVSYKDDTSDVKGRHEGNDIKKLTPHSFTSHRSRYREGNSVLHIAYGVSYEDAVQKTYEYWVEAEKEYIAKKRTEKSLAEMAAGPHYCWSLPGKEERYNGPCRSEAHAVREARKEYPEQYTFLVAETVKPDLRDFVRGYGSTLIEHLQDSAQDFAGEVTEDWLRNTTTEQDMRLDDFIHEAVLKWLKFVKEEPKFFSVTNTKTVKLLRGMDGMEVEDGQGGS